MGSVGDIRARFEALLDAGTLVEREIGQKMDSLLAGILRSILSLNKKW